MGVLVTLIVLLVIASEVWTTYLWFDQLEVADVLLRVDGDKLSPELRRRKADLLLQRGDLPSYVREQIAMAVNIIIQQARLADGQRKITHITEITGIDETGIHFEHIVLFRQTGISPDGKILGQHEFTGYVPRFIKALQEKGIAMPMNLFAQKTA